MLRLKYENSTFPFRKKLGAIRNNNRLTDKISKRTFKFLSE